MGISKENLNLVLGLKVSWLRQQRGLSLKELSEKSGMSISYLNEIEKGKKYPKADKIMSLAEALGKPYDELVSLQLDQQLMPLSELLSTSIMQEIPFDLFGLKKSDLMEFMTNAPARFAALIDTLIKIARTYDLSVENLLFGALRSYQEMQNNYFPEIEKKAAAFRKQYSLEGERLTYAKIKSLMEQEYGYNIDEEELAKSVELGHFRSLYLPKKPQRLYVNTRLTESQQLFSLCRELGYEVLELKERVPGSSYLKDATFDQLLNNTHASYFAGALLLDKDDLAADIETWFESGEWNTDALEAMISKYRVTPEMLFHRLTQIMAEKFQLGQFYFLRFNHDTNTGALKLTKELHFSKLHSTHGIGFNEHYCRRWITLRLLKEVADSNKEGVTFGAQRSLFHNTENEYFCISAVRPLRLSPGVNSCVTIGFLMDQRFKRKVRFWDDEKVVRSVVNRTCERCPIEDCSERATAPVIHEKKLREERIARRMDELFAEGSTS
ncbi:MAG: helix-turn-helix domain-containing protein [Balneolia bacterium]|nr:helix-turn-helix domain-containing protein [Balneolia bacterium]